MHGMDVTKTLGFHVGVYEGQHALTASAVLVRDGEAGQVRWIGPGPLILSPDGGTNVVWKVELNTTME